jgi:hypothetical protein
LSVREPAKTPAAAKSRYVRFFQLSLSCLTNAIWYFAERPDGLTALVASESPIHLRREKGRPGLLLAPSQVFRIIPDDRYPGEYKASTLAYIYSVHINAPEVEGTEIIAWHWHPLTTPDRVYPHIHVRADHALVGPLSKLHVPTGRVSFEEVVLFLVDELGVVPARDDWREIVSESFERFKTFRTWA